MVSRLLQSMERLFFSFVMRRSPVPSPAGADEWSPLLIIKRGFLHNRNTFEFSIACEQLLLHKKVQPLFHINHLHDPANDIK